MPFHIITLKKQKCQDVKMPRLQGCYPLGSGWLLMNLFVGARQCSSLLMCIKMGGVVNKG